MGNTTRSHSARHSNRPIVATLYFRGEPPKMRYYSRIATAFPRAVQLLMECGSPGDTVEIASNTFGYQIGTVRISVGPHINVKWTIKDPS